MKTIVPEYHHEKNICRLFRILAQFIFATNEREIDCYYQKVNKRIVSQVAERLKFWNLKKRNSK